MTYLEETISENVLSFDSSRKGSLNGGKADLAEEMKYMRYFGDIRGINVNKVLEAVRFENVNSAKRSNELLKKGIYSIDEYINMKDEAKKNYFRSSLERMNKKMVLPGTYEKIMEGIRQGYITNKELSADYVVR